MSPTLSAPGKMVLAGEYAVREGYTGVVAAVSRQSTARIQGEGAPRVEVAGAKEADLIYQDAWKTTDDDPIFALVNSALGLWKTKAEPWQGTLTLDSRSLSLHVGDLGHKLGLGSSATIAALLASVLHPFDSPAPHEIHEQAQTIHHAFSGGSGSGVDVSAACFGGILFFQRTADGVRTQEAPNIPTSLRIIPVYCGYSVSTRTFLKAVDQLKANSKSTYDGLMSSIDEGTRQFREGLLAGDTVELLDSVRSMQKAMAALGQAAHIDIVSDPHRQLDRVAASFGGAAKPSGAGGGDIGLVFIPESQENECRRALRDTGLVPLEIELGSPGLTQHRSAL